MRNNVLIIKQYRWGSDSGVVMVRLVARYADTLLNKFLTVFGITERLLTFGVEVSR